MRFKIFSKFNRIPRKIAESENPAFAAKVIKARSILQRELASGRIDRGVIRVSKKFSRLSFAWTTDSCEGHFVEEKDSRIHLTLKEAVKKPFVFYNDCHFEIWMDSSEKARLFFKEVKALEKKFPLIKVFGSPDRFDASVRLPNKQPSHAEISPQDAIQLAKQNKIFLREFERIVDKFSRKT